MHQASDQPDWVTIPPASRNQWQHLAAQTSGAATPGNFLSIIGFCLVLVGLVLVVQGNLTLGTCIVGLGRLGDAIDGTVAAKTGTKSPLGRALDATLDKIGALLALVIFTAQGVLPAWVAAAIMAQNLANIVLGLYAPWRRTTVLKPSLAGKRATAGFWIAIITFVAARLLANRLLLGGAYILASAALALGIYATAHYTLTAIASPKRAKPSH